MKCLSEHNLTSAEDVASVDAFRIDESGQIDLRALAFLAGNWSATKLQFARERCRLSGEMHDYWCVELVASAVVSATACTPPTRARARRVDVHHAPARLVTALAWCLLGGVG